MLSVLKRIKLLLLVSILLFGIEENYCSEEQLAPPVSGEQNNAHENLQAQELGSRGKFIQGYIYYEGFTNILYWLFDWYQKKPGLYWYKHYSSFGYRTRLLSHCFYFDFYVRTWINILVALNVLGYYIAMKSVSSSPGYAEDIFKKKIYDFLSNMIKLCLCFMFVPAVDLNIRLGDNFYLVIGFSDIILMYFSMYFAPKLLILGQQIMEIQLSNLSS